MGWCLDSHCGGIITGSLVWHYPFVVGVNISGAAILLVDFCVWTWLSLWGEIKSVYLHVVQY